MNGLLVALVGPDGTGKSTIARRLPAVLDGSVKTIYAGDNPEAGDPALGTTRALRWLRRRAGDAVVHGPPPVERPARRSFGRRLVAAPRSLFLLANQCAEEWARLRRARRWTTSGDVVVLDRSYLHDYWHHDVVGPGRSLRQRLHGWWLRRVLPRPDLTIVLDAPADVLYARKPEGTVAALARRRTEYADLDALTSATVVVDADRPLAVVEAAVAEVVRDHLASAMARVAP